jgi:carbamoyltransferase
MYILGISCHYHESAACILKDGVIVAASAEERFSRVKHDKSFPQKAISYCLKKAGIHKKDIAYVAFYEKPFVTFERIIMTAVSEFPYASSQFAEGMNNSFSSNLWIRTYIQDALDIPADRIVYIRF